MTGTQKVAVSILILGLAWPTAVHAQEHIAPAVTIAGFSADKTGFSSKEAEALAEALAIQLVESGRYRVLDRAFLPIKGNPSRPAISAVRAAASAAGIEYVLVGRVGKFTETRRYSPPVAPALPGLRRIGRSGHLIARPFAARTVTERHDYLRVSIELVDVKTGAVLTETTRTCPALARASGASTAASLMLAPVSPLGAVVTTIARTRASTSVDPALESALSTAAADLIRWTPAPIVR
jgi:hypothetical protein